MIGELLLQALRAAVGPANVLTGRADLAAYEGDGRTTGPTAAAVVRPASATEVAEIVRAAARAGVRLIPQGARTGLVGAGLAAADEPAILLSLDRLARAPAIDPVNRTARVDAGVRLSALNEAAAAHGLFFPIDLGADPSIGGMIAANTGGARFLRYGDVRRNLLGIELVASDAKADILAFGGAAWKDNSGLDLKHLLAGSAGSLGIVTAATLALQPRPAASVSAMLALARADRAVEILLALEAGFGTLLTAFEGMSAAALELAFAHVPRLRRPFPLDGSPYLLLVELSAGGLFDEDCLEERIAALLEPMLASGKVAAAVVDRGADLWAIRHAVPEGLRAAGHVIACDISVRRGDTMRFRADMGARVARIAPDLMICDFGHVGDGGIHFNMVWPKAGGPPDPAIVRAVREMVFEAAVREYGGSFSAEHGIGPANLHFYDRFVPDRTRRLAGAVQRVLAPWPCGRVDFGGSAQAAEGAGSAS